MRLVFGPFDLRYGNSYCSILIIDKLILVRMKLNDKMIFIAVLLIKYTP